MPRRFIPNSAIEREISRTDLRMETTRSLPIQSLEDTCLRVLYYKDLFEDMNILSDVQFRGHLEVKAKLFPKSWLRETFSHIGTNKP